MKINITEEHDGLLLRDLLRRELHVSAKLLARLKRDENGILVNGEAVTVRRILHVGDIVEISDFPEEPPTHIEAVELPVNIVYEDEYMLVADKPPFMPTHPSHDHHYDTLANALAYRYREIQSPYIFRPVSRLDRNTSGLVTVAKTKYASAQLNRVMHGGGFSKQYLAILEGVLPENEGEIDACLHRTAASVILREVCPPDAPDAEPSLTRYRVIFSDGKHSVVLASPVTGRTHQLRVHFDSLGATILGDDLYGKESDIIPRHALHAIALNFRHPITNEEMKLFSPLPDDILKALRAVFGEAKAEEILNMVENQIDQGTAYETSKP